LGGFRLGRAPMRLPGRKAEAGVGLIEFAFIVIVFMVMLLGIIDFSRALYSYHYVSNMARRATRWAAVNGYTCTNDSSCNGMNGMNNGPASKGDIQAYVANHVPAGIDPSKITTTVDWPPQANSPTICSQPVTGYAASPYPNYPGCTVAITVSYEFNFLYPLVRSTAITLSSTSEMVIAH
jgi:Flp pilus assembly protein TadG